MNCKLVTNRIIRKWYATIPIGLNIVPKRANLIRKILTHSYVRTSSIGKKIKIRFEYFFSIAFNHSFGWMKANKMTSFDSTDETKGDKKGTYERVINLKKKNPDLKILLAVGMK